MNNPEEQKPSIVIKCSNCSRKLMSVMLADQEAIDPDTKLPFAWQLTATCPYCGDQSFPHEVRGRIYPVGYAEPNQENVEDVYIKTFIEETDYDKNKVLFHIKEAGVSNR